MIEFNEKNYWSCAKWVSFNFFEDALRFIDLKSELGKKIHYLNDVRIDTLCFDLIDDEDKLSQFEKVLLDVLKFNEETKGEHWKDNTYHYMYFDKLLELKELFYKVYKKE
jgi:hypothetical protein